MEPYMVSNTIKYSDGTETVVNYDNNPAAAEIEQSVAEAVAITSPEETPVEVEPIAPESSQIPTETPSESTVVDAQTTDETVA